MAHFAQIDENNIVLRVIVIDDSLENEGQNYINNILGLSGTWLKTSYNTNNGLHKLGGTPFRKNFAGAGFTYDAEKDAFIEPKPDFASWVLNEETCRWEAPKPYPGDGLNYIWSENSLNWIVSEGQ
jgi:hypothetical protein